MRECTSSNTTAERSHDRPSSRCFNVSKQLVDILTLLILNSKFAVRRSAKRPDPERYCTHRYHLLSLDSVLDDNPIDVYLLLLADTIHPADGLFL